MKGAHCMFDQFLIRSDSLKNVTEYGTVTGFKFAVRIAATGGTNMIVEWLLGGMKMEKQELVRYIKHTLPIDILKFLQNDTDMTF